MSVLVEALTVAVKNQTIEGLVQGGVPAFEKHVPNATFRTDQFLSAASFMDPEATGDFIDGLLSVGMNFVKDGVAQDIVVIDQHRGPTAKCDWLEFEKTKEGLSIAWLTGHSQGGMAVYENWTAHNDLVFRDGRFEETFKFLRTENGLDVFLDLETGQEHFRPQSTLPKIGND